jgi:hypothetical protein
MAVNVLLNIFHAFGKEQKLIPTAAYFNFRSINSCFIVLTDSIYTFSTI